MQQKPAYAFYQESLPEWGIDSILIAEDGEGNQYFQFRPVCEALHLGRSKQNAFIQSDSRTRRGAKTIEDAPTAGGPQPALFLRKRETAIWLTCIDPDKVNGIARGQLEDFQAALWGLAERTVFRRHMVAHAVTERVDTGPLPGHCPVCGAAIRQDPATAVYVRAEE